MAEKKSQEAAKTSKTSKTPAKASKVSKPDKASAKTPSSKLAPLALIIALAALGTSGYSFYQLQTQAANTQQALSQQAQSLTQQINTNQTSLTQLLDTKPNTDSLFQLQQTLQLLETASYYANLIPNKHSAVALLNAADKQLHDQQDPRLNAVRKVIAEDLAKLKAIPDVDKPGLINTLSALQQQVLALQVNNPISPPLQKADKAKTPTAQKISAWRERAHNAWQELRSFIIIRHHDEAIKPLLAPDDAQLVKLQMQLALQQAQVAVIHPQQALFEDSLKQVEQQLNNYFTHSDASTKAIKSQLDSLRQQKIYYALPDISDAYLTLKAQLKSLNKRRAS